MCLAVSLIPVGIIGGIKGFQFTSLMLIVLILFVTFIVSLAISYLITKPIERLTQNIDEISKGKLDTNLEYNEIHEINKLTDSLNRVMASLKLAIHKVGVKKGEIFQDALRTKETYEKKQEDFINSIHGWAWETDEKGVFTFCSESISKWLDYNCEEIVGTSLFNLVSSEDVKKLKNIFNDAIKNKKPFTNFECINITKKGENTFALLNGCPFFNESGDIIGFRGVINDITALKQSQNKIKNLNTQLSDLKSELNKFLNEKYMKPKKKQDKKDIKEKLDEKWSEHEFDSIFIFNENADILDCNDNMYKKLGYTKSEMLSLNIADFDALESKKDILEKVKKAKKEGSISFKTIHKRKDGSAVLVHENMQYLKDKNTFKCVVREDYSLKKSS